MARASNSTKKPTCPSPGGRPPTGAKKPPRVKETRKKFIRRSRALDEGLNRDSKEGVEDLLKKLTFADQKFSKASKKLF